MRISKNVRTAFANVETIGELRGVYLEQFLKYKNSHYTNQLNALYIEKFDEVKECRRTLKGKIYRKPTEETASFFLNAVNTIKGLDGINCEMSGDWMWVTGETKKVKESLKMAGCTYSAKRQAWYIA